MIYELSKMREEDVYSINLRCVRSYVYYHVTKKYKKVTDLALEQTNYKWEESTRWWVTNTARALRANASGFVYSLSKETYSGSVQGIG